MQITLIAMNTKEFGERLKAARESQGKTQQQVADHADMSRVAVGQWEAGDIKKGVDAEKLFKVCECLDVSMPYMLFGQKGRALLPSERLAELWPKLTTSQKEEHLSAIEQTAQRNAELLAELKR